MAERWDLELGRSFDGGTASLVLAAEAGGEPCVLKLPMLLVEEDAEAVRRTVLVHGLADGRGCARLLRHDLDAPALLLERLGPDLHRLGLPIPEVLETVAATLRSFWRPVGPDADVRTGADQAAWLAEHITIWWDELGHPCRREVVDRALAYCETRAAAHDPSSSVLVHGDAHGWNTLAAPGGGFKFVDPEGLRSEAAHDLAVPMREYNEPLLAGDTKRLVRERAELLAGWCEVDPVAVWEWGFVERVSTGLLGLRDFEGDGPKAFLEVAERCL
jgi:streptomycin 6-kinase